MDKTMSQRTRKEVLEKLRRRYRKAGLEHKSKLVDQAQELVGYHRKSAVRSLCGVVVARVPWVYAGRPGEGRCCGTRFRFVGAYGRRARQDGWRWILWHCAEAVWPENLFGCSTEWITRRRGWSCEPCGGEGRPERWQHWVIWKPACLLRYWD